jgi:hypothetical protein
MMEGIMRGTGTETMRCLTNNSNCRDDFMDRGAELQNNGDDDVKKLSNCMCLHCVQICMEWT